jgi:hypothetical protein
MKPHELLRQAALILADGWSHNTKAPIAAAPAETDHACVDQQQSLTF